LGAVDIGRGGRELTCDSSTYAWRDGCIILTEVEAQKESEYCDGRGRDDPGWNCKAVEGNSKWRRKMWKLCKIWA